MISFKHTKTYQDWDYRRGLYGRPDPALTLPFSYVGDRLRWGALGRYIWRSRRVPGWMRGPEAVRLAQAAFDLPDGAIVVELGTFLGCSAVLLAGARKLRNSGRVHCVDPFDASGDAFSVPIYEAVRHSEPASLRARCERHLEQAGVRDWVQIHAARAEQVAPTWTQPIDLLLLDGDQSAAAVTAAYDLWLPFLKPGGLLVVHNSRAGYRQESHDGSARLVEERVQPPAYSDVQCVKSLTFARKRPPDER